MNRLLAPAVLLALSLGAASPGEAEELMGRSLNPGSGLSPGGRFGGAVAVATASSPWGAYLSDKGGADSGTVYLFRKEKWSLGTVLGDLLVKPASNSASTLRSREGGCSWARLSPTSAESAAALPINTR